jgi:hypothetical protein
MAALNRKRRRKVLAEQQPHACAMDSILGNMISEKAER